MSSLGSVRSAGRKLVHLRIRMPWVLRVREGIGSFSHAVRTPTASRSQLLELGCTVVNSPQCPRERLQSRVMSHPAATPAPFSTPLPVGQQPTSKPRRLLACILCQQRKVKCDHCDPCATCIKARVPCIQAVQAKRRRRRHCPDSELLARLRRYEQLMTQHNVKFEPLLDHPFPSENASPVSPEQASCALDDEGTPEASRSGVSEAKLVPFMQETSTTASAD